MSVTTPPSNIDPQTVETPVSVETDAAPKNTTPPVAYRCNKCWQLTHAYSDQAGQSIPCLSCSTVLVVPQPTPELLEAGEKFVREFDSNNIARFNFDEQVDPAQISRIAEDTIRRQMIDNGSVGAMACSRVQRLFGSLIDVFAGVGAILLGALLGSLISPGEEPDALAVTAFLMVPLMLAIYQACLISNQGRTLGKFCVGIKIVDINGNPPGFVKGVLVRNVLVSFMGVIPFFSLVNACWIFGPESRCLHDLLAGTYVIDAV